MRVAPGGPPQAQPGPEAGPQGGGQPSPAEQGVQMIDQGFTILGKIIQSAGQQVPPELAKAFQVAAQATDQLLQILTSPAGEQQGAPPQGKPSPGGPMAANANANAQPAGPQG